MVSIEKQYCLQFLESKKVALPADLVVQHNGNDYLKLRSSHYKILQVACGQKAPQKNATLAGNSNLQALKQKRDQALAQMMVPECVEDNMGLGDSQPTKKKAKVSKSKDTHVVTIDVQGQQVPVLVSTFRSGQADLQVLMDSKALSAVFHFLGLAEEKNTAAQASPEEA